MLSHNGLLSTDTFEYARDVDVDWVYAPQTYDARCVGCGMFYKIFGQGELGICRDCGADLEPRPHMENRDYRFT